MLVIQQLLEEDYFREHPSNGRETQDKRVPEPLSPGDDYDDQSAFVGITFAKKIFFWKHYFSAHVLDGPEIQTKELKILTPPPEARLNIFNKVGVINKIFQFSIWQWGGILFW